MKEDLFNIGSDDNPLPFLSKEVDLTPHKQIRIAVTGDVLINKLETKIIDTPAFQRLRKLKQLGSTYIVFPTAVHTRFDHSLGTMQMASRMVGCIAENRHNTEDEKRISDVEHQLVRLLALLHDIGHIPFGHTIEDEFNLFERHDEDAKRINQLIGKDSTIGNYIYEDLGDDFYQRFYRLMTTSKKRISDLGDDAFIYDIVNNTVCADLLDYLQRDYFFCNLSLGLEYRFLNFLYIFKDENDCRRTAVRLWKEGGEAKPRPDILGELVSLLDHRFKIGAVAYFHHAKIISGTMLAGAVHRALKNDHGLITKEMLYNMGDEELILKLKSSTDPVVKKLIQAYDDRNLWKTVYTKSRKQIDAEQLEDSSQSYIDLINENFHANSDNRYNVEKQIAEDLGMEDGDVLIHCPKDDMQLKYAEMKVYWEGKYKPLSECEDEELTSKKLKLILQSHRNLYSVRVFINPKYKELEEDVKMAAENFLCINKTKKRKLEKEYIDRVVDINVPRLFDVSEVTLEQMTKFKAQAKDVYLNATREDRKHGTLLEIIKEIGNGLGFKEKK